MTDGKDIDPVSGNEIPFGSSAKNVRDDVPILASEGEYVISADVVKFLGLEKIERMCNKAKDALAEMGALMGEDKTDGMVEDDELPFDSSELEGVPHLAEGGEVVGTGFSFPQDNGYTGVKEFKNKDGSVMYIPFVNGAPLYSAPDGYTEAAAPAKGDDPESAPNKAAAQIQQPLQPLMDNSAKENGAFVEANKSPLAGSPNEWKVEDFINFGRNRDSVGNQAMKGIISMMPGGKLAVGAREKWLDKAVNTQFDTMLETGLDPMGNPITPDQRNQLLSTRENLKKDMSKNTGISFSPMETLANAVQRFTSFSGEGITSPKSAMGSNMINSNADRVGYTYQGGNDKVGSNLNNNRSDNQYSGSTYGGAGNKDGSSSQSANDNAKSGSGGLYAEGGYVTKRRGMKDC